MSKKNITLEKIVKEEATLFIKDARKKISSQLEAALLSIIGLEKKNYGIHGYEIDHCNNRNSVLIDAFKTYAKEEAEKIAKSYKPTKEDIGTFRNAFEKEFRSQMNYIVLDLAKQKAIQIGNSIIEEIKIDVDEIINNSIK